MQTRITARHFDASSDLVNHIESRVVRLDRYYDGITDAHVILSQTLGGHPEKEAEVKLSVFRHTLTASYATETHEESIDKCVESLRRQLLKHKDRLRDTKTDQY